MPVTVTLPSYEEVDDVYNPRPRMVYDAEQLAPAANVIRVVMGCVERVAEPRPVRRDAETREAMRAEAAARMAEVSAESRARFKADFEEYQADAQSRLSKPSSKPSKKRGKSSGTKRGPNRNTKARWAAEDLAAGVNNYEDLSPALSDENDKLLDFELDDLSRDIQGALK